MGEDKANEIFKDLMFESGEYSSLLKAKAFLQILSKDHLMK